LKKTKPRRKAILHVTIWSSSRYGITNKRIGLKIPGTFKYQASFSI